MNKELIAAVIEQLNVDDVEQTFQEVRKYGANSGFSGFIYYKETCEFYNENKGLIVELAKDMADDFGQDLIGFVAGFNCLTDDTETRDEIGRAIYGNTTNDDCQVENALAWLALEEVAQSFES
jgi:hypothetical protein|tara:strand:- start:100 stop:468 length:369 start_codon:yes stop_codon:yes gene_type:complete